VDRYYNSFYDEPQYAGLVYPASLNESEKYNYVGELAEHIQNLSTAVAQAVYSYLNVSDVVPAECAADGTTVNMRCLVIEIQLIEPGIRECRLLDVSSLFSHLTITRLFCQDLTNVFSAAGHPSLES
jgi:hypothetical protein